MLSVDRLRVLHAIAAHGSLSAAAEALHVTNSAVSQQLAKLEREVGQTLVERNGRGVRLTDAAELLVEHAARILSLVRRAEADLEAHRDHVTGHLRLSATPTAVRGILPQALNSLREAHPRLRVELFEEEPHESLQSMARGEVDLCMVIDWMGSPLTLPEGMSRAPLMEDIGDIALPADHPLAHREILAIDEILELPWISWSRGSICNDWLYDMIRSRGGEPNVVHNVEEHQTKLALIAAGIGAAVMPRLGRGPLPDGVRVVPVQPALVRQVYAFWHTDASRRPAIRASVRALREAASAYDTRPVPA
ncbi:LysR family transcriptional regulator [Nocardiopsis flavescens]|uniref:ModE molybdate transport repressor domain-containing protein n=1 Tax=Nocardiopsis flavescens TaxID=758803 RepID=A0A1M6EW45_9ACTN|nr:LysR family transcriptional regulator [Nocardiopsis flavescens]SHI89648.1 ModE molybdate transport repressor domain-containing protein [Nocardiopsis flavescens]